MITPLTKKLYKFSRYSRYSISAGFHRRAAFFVTRAAVFDTVIHSI